VTNNFDSHIHWRVQVMYFYLWDNPVTLRNYAAWICGKWGMIVLWKNGMLWNRKHTEKYNKLFNYQHIPHGCLGASHTLRNVSILKLYHRVTGQSRNSAMYQGRHQYEYNLCHKNHVRLHYYRILWLLSHETKFWYQDFYMPMIIQDSPLIMVFHSTYTIFRFQLYTYL